MRSSLLALVGSTVVAFAAPQPPPSAPPASVEVSGAIPKPGRLAKSDLTALGPKTATWQVHGKSLDVTGVRLDKVLTHLGFSPGPMGREVPVADKRAGYRKVLRATARDGYQAVFSVAELSEGMGRTEVLVVWAVDGKSLDAEEGPLRLVALTDGEPSRSIRQLERLEVIELPSKSR